MPKKDPFHSIGSFLKPDFIFILWVYIKDNIVTLQVNPMTDEIRRVAFKIFR